MPVLCASTCTLACHERLKHASGIELLHLLIFSLNKEERPRKLIAERASKTSKETICRRWNVFETASLPSGMEDPS